MKLQLTKTKTIEINFPGGGSSGGGSLSDVTGVLLNSGDPRGCPAVRLQHRKNAWNVLAAGFVPPPGDELPTSWETAKEQSAWGLPSAFQAPHAALAVVSPEMFIRQTSPDALLLDLGAAAPAAAASAQPRKKLGVHREAASPTMPVPAEKGGRAAEVKPGRPASANGLRFVTAALADEPSVLQSGLPEYQVLWLSRLLPEGRRPTAASVQTLPSALLASLCEQPAFNEVGGTAFVIFVMKTAVYLAAYREGSLLMFRQCPGAAGWEMLREGVKLRLGIDDEMVDAILDDVIVDPRSAMEPFVRPVLQQLEISLDYLSSRHAMRVDRVFLMGLPSGARYWTQIAEEHLRLPLVAPSVFEGLNLPAKDAALRALEPSQTQVFLAAYGAARAAMEGRA